MNHDQLTAAKKLFFILLWIDIAITAVVGINAFSTIGVFKEIQSGDRTADSALISNLEFWDGFSKLIFLTMIGVGLGLVKWLNSCYGFAKDSLGATGFKNEGWTAGGWIIPIVNLFKPYQIINEIYKAGAPNYLAADDWKKESGSGLLLTWWVFWAVTHFIVWIFAKTFLKGAWRDDITLQQGIAMLHLQAWSCVWSIVIAGLWIMVANNLTQRLVVRSSLSRVPSGIAVADGYTSAPLRSSKANDASVESMNLTSDGHDQPNTLSTEKKLEVETNGAASHVASFSDEKFFAMAFQELNSGRAVQGLWAKCFAETDGDENKAKARYLSARAPQLKADHDARVQEEARRFRALEEAARAAAEEGATRTADAEQKRRRLVEAGHVAHATLEECFALLAEAGYRVERIDTGYSVRSTRDFSPTVLKNLVEVRFFVEKNITFSQASQEECAAALMNLGCDIALKSNGLYSVRLPGGAKRVLEKVDEFRELLRKLLTKGRCPNCAAEIALNSQGCPRCNAIFTGTSTWKIRPPI